MKLETVADSYQRVRSTIHYFWNVYLLGTLGVLTLAANERALASTYLIPLVYLIFAFICTYTTSRNYKYLQALHLDLQYYDNDEQWKGSYTRNLLKTVNLARQKKIALTAQIIILIFVSIAIAVIQDSNISEPSDRNMTKVLRHITEMKIVLHTSQIHTFFQVSSAGLAIVATIIWLNESLSLKTSKTLRESQLLASFDDRKQLAKNLIKLKYTGIFVVAIMILSFLFQLIYMSLPKTWDSTIFNLSWCIIAVIFCICIGTGIWRLESHLLRKEELQVAEEIDREENDTSGAP